MSRKTANVDDVRIEINDMIAHNAKVARSDNLAGDAWGAAYRLGLAMALERVLFAANRYRGFTYNNAFDENGVLKDQYDDSDRRYL